MTEAVQKELSDFAMNSDLHSSNSRLRNNVSAEGKSIGASLLLPEKKIVLRIVIQPEIKQIYLANAVWSLKQ